MSVVYNIEYRLERGPINRHVGIVTYTLYIHNKVNHAGSVFREDICSAWLDIGREAELDEYMKRRLFFRAKHIRGLPVPE